MSKAYARLNNLLLQLKPDPAIEDVKRAQAIERVRHSLLVPTSLMRLMQLHFLESMREGLENDVGATVKMLSSFVFKKKTENVSGDFYALDLGGTNFRVLKLTIKKGKVSGLTSKKFAIAQKDMKGTADGLFGFIARSVKESVGPAAQGDLGFTFSFPMKQITISSAVLLSWTKGFTTTGVENEDVCALLMEAFAKEGVKLEIAAICNDTVGTLVTQYFKDTTSQIGMILGTGFNACYFEKVKNITKYKPAAGVSLDDEMIINMECGAWDNEKIVLPITKYDEILDFHSPNIGQQRYEKMVGGMYLGEICRLIFEDLSKRGVLSRSAPIKGVFVKGGLPTKELSLCLNDNTAELTNIATLFEAGSRLEDRQLLKEIAGLVTLRAARLAATSIATVVTKTQTLRDATIAIDGSLFEHVPFFKQHMADALDELFAGQHGIRLVLTKDGSGIGAGLIAALVK